MNPSSAALLAGVAGAGVVETCKTLGSASVLILFGFLGGSASAVRQAAVSSNALRALIKVVLITYASCVESQVKFGPRGEKHGNR